MTRQSISRRQAAASKEVLAIGAARDAAIRKMPEALFQKFQAIEGISKSISADNIRHYYSIGQHVCAVRDEPSKYVGSGGESGTALLESALATSRRMLRACAKFATMFSEEQKEELATLEAPSSKYRLHWGHINVLLTAPTAAAAMELAVESAEGMLEPQALHSLVKERHPRERQGHGPKPRLPKEIVKQVQQILRVTQGWLKRAKTIWIGEGEDNDNVFDNIDNADPSQYDADLLAQLEKLVEGVNDLHVQTEEMSVRAIKTMERVRNVLPEPEPANPAPVNRARSGRRVDV